MSNIKPGKLSQFRPATRNANKHTGRGLKLLADAMNEVGYVAPITVAADGLVCALPEHWREQYFCPRFLTVYT